MKILFLSSSLAPHFGGAAFSESALSAQLGKELEVTVLSRNKRLDLNFANQQGVQRVKPFNPFSVFLAFLIPWHPISCEIRKSDVFHLNGHWFWENYFFARICYRYHVPYILHPRGMLWVAYRRPRLKKLFNLFLGNWIVSHAAKIILLSHFERKHLASYQVNQDQIEVIPNGISRVAPIQKETHLGSYFLYLGRIEVRKNLEFLIRAFSKVYRLDNEIRLRLVGPIEREYDTILIQLIQSLGLEKSITIEPPIYDKDKVVAYQQALAVVYPAVEEPFGRTVFEAFAAGTVCVVPEKSGGAEYVKQFAPELIYEDQSENSLAEKMTEINRWSKEMRDKKLELSRDWVLTHLDWKQIAQNVTRLYQQVSQNGLFSR